VTTYKFGLVYTNGTSISQGGHSWQEIINLLVGIYQTANNEQVAKLVISNEQFVYDPATEVGLQRQLAARKAGVQYVGVEKLDMKAKEEKKT